MKRLTRIAAFAALLIAVPLFFTACTGARCANCGKTVKIDTLDGVLFDFDKATVKPEGQKILDKDVELLKKDKSLDVSVEGHCDYIGSDQYNQQLSVKRAQAVADYLTGKGVAKDHMKVVGFGRSKPIAPNTTPEGRAKNRRVELHIIKARAN
jgi:OmpA-OmpF porin, OOP family